MASAFRSSSWRFSINYVCRNFAKLHEKTCAGVFFFDKVAGGRPATLFKKTPTQVLCRELCEILKNNFSPKTLANGCFCVFFKISSYTRNINKQM